MLNAFAGCLFFTCDDEARSAQIQKRENNQRVGHSDLPLAHTAPFADGRHMPSLLFSPSLAGVSSHYAIYDSSFEAPLLSSLALASCFWLLAGTTDSAVVGGTVGLARSHERKLSIPVPTTLSDWPSAYRTES